ncbi:cell division protein SepF [Gloeocapsa sp. PCC 73106]|uniref:cell division protein SepF n=1 Tax=Gloeocapsa sp. PCC 73106 TaxID=102232 RepID=UPI0002ACF7C9|nr:cell division protein SepF [Gloeocapsa sp. PCC 73106]ELR97122.1 hypothetical protein GLO73106DRAFT_00009260 [Gloeocapsa sp. PCC 73106]
MSCYSPFRIIVIQPVSLEAIFQLEKAFQFGNAIILNTSGLKPHQADRFRDILTKYAVKLKGEIITIEENIFLLRRGYL